MATSSIFAKVKITDEKNAKVLVDALEKANNLPRTEPTTEPTITANLITDKKAIKALFAKRVSK